MATLLQIHSAYIKEIFENTPRLLPKDRETLFELPAWAETVLAHLHSDVSRLGFILQLGYFRATHRFFLLSRFQREDTQFIISRYRLSLEPEEIGAYPSSTHWDHQGMICAQMGFSRFSKTHREQLVQEAQRLSRAHMRPDELFDYLICYLEERRVEIPSYRTFAELITNAFLFVEKQLLTQIEQVLTPADEAWLDQLLQPHSDYGTNDDRQVKRYTLTFLKNMSQSLRTGSIRERVEHYRYLQLVYNAIKPLVAKLNLPDQSIRYYAQYVLRAQPAQLYRRDKQRYLYLMEFIIHQYFEWTDALVDTLLQAVSHFFSHCEARLKEQYYEEREVASQLTQQVTDRSREQLTALAAIRQVVKKNKLNQAQKLHQIEQLIDQYFPRENDWQAGVDALNQLEKINDRYHQQDAYYEWLSKNSIKLQRKVSNLLRLLEIDQTTSRPDLVQALRHYTQHKELGASPPINFLPLAQQGKILVVLGRIRVSLYKVLLFQQAALAIKSGQLNFNSSYRYRAFERYLIPAERWQRDRVELLQRANLNEFINSETVLDTLAIQLREQFKQTNERILLGQKVHVIRKKDKLIIQTPKTALDTLIQPYELFPTNKVVSLQEVLATVNRLTGFTNALTHWQPKHIPKRPANNLFLADIMALGCNVGVRRMAQITRSVSENSLDEVVKWCCTLDNLRQANESVLLFNRELKLRIHLKDHPDVTYTSSDGQKMEVAQDSLMARPSFKYFGNRKGITAYNYTDDTMLLFDSLVFSAGDREATYLLNSLVNTRIVDSDVHSSDSHGATEPVFASTYLMGIHFEPRIKRLLYQQFYSIDPLSQYKDQNYPLTPRGRINPERIKAEWDTILRLMVTIKLHHSPPSELFNRLNSYARLHPVYQGLREFGRIIKTIFLLRYIDQIAVRQRIQRQLNRSESVHQLARSVWFGRHGQMGWVNQAEQQVAETAKRLIMNCIICYNYLHVSETLSKMTDRNERHQFIQRLSKLTVLTHHHINFNGIYDFPEDVADWNLPFDLSNISDLEF